MRLPIPLAYTFGNHMHFVDMEWLWGYEVLPGSVGDMLEFCKQTGARGQVNFDAVGYERLAAQAPQALVMLQAAVADGTIEPVGCSYGQPYGQFHGGESNVRQLIFGARTTRRLLGVWPRAFWEEEFYLFPQLPQMLCLCGYDAASLFFQWTWHTPEIPMEESPVVLWEGHDDTRIPAATRNRLNVHQWPEDLDKTLDELALQFAQRDPAAAEVPPLMLQWLELMPSPDWMCRSELLIPRMRGLLSDERFVVQMVSLREYVLQAAAKADLPVRQYGPSDVWHGMSLGKNGDQVRRLSQQIEGEILLAESLATMHSLFGRPYAQWDVYPTWELEEAWRKLLTAQHHDIDECEGLCGRVGLADYQMARTLASSLSRLHLGKLAKRTARGRILLFNPLGWARSEVVGPPGIAGKYQTPPVPAFGWLAVEQTELRSLLAAWEIGVEGASGRSGGIAVHVSANGLIDQVLDEETSANVLDAPLRPPTLSIHGIKHVFEFRGMSVGACAGELDLQFEGPEGSTISMHLGLGARPNALDVHICARDLPRPDGRMAAGLRWTWPLIVSGLVVDHPYGVSDVAKLADGRRKYPTGDWMTSPQEFEVIDNPLHALSLVGVRGADGIPNVALFHDGNQQWFFERDGLTCLLCMYDPWDEEYFVSSFHAAFRLVVGADLTPSALWRSSQEFRRPLLVGQGEGHAETTLPVPPRIQVGPTNVALTAWYRETSSSASMFLPGYACAEVEHPFIVRLVEFDGLDVVAELMVPGPVAGAWKTDLLGNRLQQLEVEAGGADSIVGVPMRQHEIATVMLDIVPGRKQYRNLDAKREIWAQVHRAKDA